MAQGTQAANGNGAVGGCEASGGGSQSIADQLFSKLDTNGDGSVSKSELESAFQSVASANGTDPTTATQQADDLFAKLDTNGDGSVSQTEVEQGMRPHGHHHHHHHAASSGGAGASSDPLAALLGQGTGTSTDSTAASGSSTTGTGTNGTGTNGGSDASQNLLTMLEGLTGQQSTNSVRAQMMNLLLNLQSSGTTQTAAVAA
jgi:hypothetical protein